MFELIISLILAVLIGMTLSVIGGGGSILTVPVFVYILGIPATEATAYSLFVVGATAALSAIGYQKEGLIAWKEGIIFAIPSLFAVFLVRSYILPGIPDSMGAAIGLSFSKDLFIMVLFAIIMGLASYSMIRSKVVTETNKHYSPALTSTIIMIEGFGVGGLTGLVGAGGGFLIIPALVLLLRMPIKKAIGTSLMIIAAKSMIGFTGDLIALPDIDWSLILLFTAFAFTGVFIGLRVAKYIPSEGLKKGFGIFIAVMAAFILITELIL
jgi:uncharacterized protein